MIRPSASRIFPHSGASHAGRVRSTRPPCFVSAPCCGYAEDQHLRQPPPRVVRVLPRRALSTTTAVHEKDANASLFQHKAKNHARNQATKSPPYRGGNKPSSSASNKTNQADMILTLPLRGRGQQNDPNLPPKLLHRVRNQWPTVLGLQGGIVMLEDSGGTGRDQDPQSKNKTNVRRVVRNTWAVSEESIREACQALLYVNQRLRDGFWVTPTMRARNGEYQVNTSAMCSLLGKMYSEREGEAKAIIEGNITRRTQKKNEGSLFDVTAVTIPPPPAKNRPKSSGLPLAEESWVDPAMSEPGSSTTADDVTDTSSATSAAQRDVNEKKQKLRALRLLTDCSAQVFHGLQWAPQPARAKFLESGARLVDVTLEKAGTVRGKGVVWSGKNQGERDNHHLQQQGDDGVKIPEEDLKAPAFHARQLMREWLGTPIAASTTQADRAQILHEKVNAFFAMNESTNPKPKTFGNHHEEPTRLNVCFEPASGGTQIAFRPLMCAGEEGTSSDTSKNTRNAGRKKEKNAGDRTTTTSASLKQNQNQEVLRRDRGLQEDANYRMFWEIVEVSEPDFQIDPAVDEVFAPNPEELDAAAAELADAWIQHLKTANAVAAHHHDKETHNDGKIRQPQVLPRQKKILLHFPHGRKAEWLQHFVVLANNIVQEETGEMFCLRPVYLDFPPELLKDKKGVTVERMQRTRTTFPAEKDPTKWKLHGIFFDLYAI
ncbi:unnamed protein product [Amoebophrya sp. A120]|nr:unnamed protein product [Amoebophrya sp. A120]|eukprot:GSA120T00007874001.1